MQQFDTYHGEDDLIRLLLKRQSELNSLLEITRAINKNMATPILLQMFEMICKNHLQIGRLRFLVDESGHFNCITKYGGAIENDSDLLRSCRTLRKIREPHLLQANTDPILSTYDFFIPVFQKNKAIGYALIGDFKSPQEMLGNDLNFMQTLINVIMVALENKRLFLEQLDAERLKREMELAGEVQNMLIPLRSHTEDTFEMSARYEPHQNVGGDYFDFIRLNDNEFMWCVADVSGKGISAALLMANLQASLRAWVTVEDDLASIIERLNTIVLKNTQGDKFITIFLARYNEQTRKLSYVNAGHNPAILYSRGEVVQLKLGTTMIGVFEELPFINQGEVDIDPGTLIFNYTDGLLDREPDVVKLWNEDTLLDCVMHFGKLSPSKFNQHLLNHIKQNIKAKPIDDVTMLTFKIF